MKEALHGGVAWSYDDTSGQFCRCFVTAESRYRVVSDTDLLDAVFADPELYALLRDLIASPYEPEDV